MRYDSLLNFKKWPCDSSKGSGTPTLWPSHSVKLFRVLPNHPFSNLDCSGLECSIFLKFDLVVSKWPKFNNCSIFFKNVTDFMYFRPSKLRVFSWLPESCLTMPDGLNIMVCHLVTSWRLASCHSPMSRGVILG